MKALKIFLTLFCMGVIVSCSKDEPAPAKEQPTPQQTNFPTIKNFSAQEVTVGDIITIEERILSLHKPTELLLME